MVLDWLLALGMFGCGFAFGKPGHKEVIFGPHRGLPGRLYGSTCWVWIDLGLGWYGLGWAGFAWVELGWVGLGWVGLGWVGLGWVGLGWVGLGWVGLGWVFLRGWCYSAAVGLV